MLSVLTVILLLIVFVVLLVLLVLFAAMDIVFDVKGSLDDIEHSVTIHWLFFSKQVSPEEDESSELPDEMKDAEKFVTEKVTGQFEEEKRKDKRKKEKKKKRSMDMSFSEMFMAFRQLRSPVIKLLKGIVHAIKVPYAKINAVYGFPDPAYTGIACGYSHAVMSYLSCNIENLKTYLEPDFTDARFDIDMTGKVRIRLYRFIPAILMFVMNMNVLRFSWDFFIKKKSKKSA